MQKKLKRYLSYLQKYDKIITINLSGSLNNRYIGGYYMSLQRIDKILSSQNIATRSETKNLIKKGLIKVNDLTVLKPDEKFDPEKSEITVNEKIINYKKHLYIIMNKPAGVLSASRDKHEKTVIDLLSSDLHRANLFPAGRLDKDTEGLILITDDGEFAHKILSPKNHVYKLYEAECDKMLTVEDVKHFAEGITAGDISFLPAEMKIIGKNTALVEICEGKFHQIKRMFKSIGAEVTHLKRLRIGEFTLDKSLSPGEYRELKSEEINMFLSKKHGI